MGDVMGNNGSTKVDEFIRNLQIFTYLTRHTLENQLADEASERTISFSQLNLMRVLGKYPGKTVGDVSRYMGVSYPAATKTIDKLVKLGYLRRKEDFRDRRIAHLHLTPLGQRVVEKYSQSRDEQVQRILEKLGDDKRNTLNRQILEFARILVEDARVTNSSACIQCGAFDPEYCRRNGEVNGDCAYLTRILAEKAGEI